MYGRAASFILKPVEQLALSYTCSMNSLKQKASLIPKLTDITSPFQLKISNSYLGTYVQEFNIFSESKAEWRAGCDLQKMLIKSRESSYEFRHGQKIVHLNGCDRNTYVNRPW